MTSSNETAGSARELRVAGQPVRTTAAYDTYWRFAAARQQVFFNRIAQRPPPWTSDPIISAHRFTNVYRASDRVSQFLISDVIYDGLDRADEDIFFRIVLFKLFNRIETWKALESACGNISWKGYDFKKFNTCLDRIFAKDTVYSAAYIMPAPAFGESRKHANHLRLVEHMMRDGAPLKATNSRSLGELFRVFRSYRSLGDFLAFQLAIDLNYSTLTDFSEMDFVVAGPGARDGISKCFVGLGDVAAESVITMMADVAASEFDRLGLSFATLWGRPLQLIDCQNVFCELSKYARVAHPEIEGVTGRTRIKQKFRPSDRPLPQMYPPKWGLNEQIRASVLPSPVALQQTFAFVGT